MGRIGGGHDVLLDVLNGHGDGLGESEAAALAAVVRGGPDVEPDGRRPYWLDGDRRAWVAVAELCRQGIDVATLEGLQLDGWLDPWELPAGRAFTLSAWAAARLRLELHERWTFPTTTEPADPKRPDSVRPRVEYAVEIASWRPVPPPREVGARKKREYIYLPKARREIRLPDWSAVELVDARPGPCEQAIITEEYLMAEARDADGAVERDPETGLPRLARLTLLGVEVPLARPGRIRGKA